MYHLILSTRGSNTIAPCDSEGVVNWDSLNITEPTLSILKAVYERDKDNLVIIPDSEPQPLVAEPNWDGLNAAILSGVLNPIYNQLFAAAFGDLAINTAFTVLISAIQTTRVEAAVASAFAALKAYTSYRFSDDEVINGEIVEGEKTIWNRTTDSLGFSELMHLS